MATAKKTQKSFWSQTVTTGKDLWDAGFARTLLVKDQSGDRILALPLTIAVIGAILAPPVAVIGVFVALLTQCSLTVEKK
jgi:hypothetical protein